MTPEESEELLAKMQTLGIIYEPIKDSYILTRKFKECHTKWGARLMNNDKISQELREKYGDNIEGAVDKLSEMAVITAVVEFGGDTMKRELAGDMAIVCYKIMGLGNESSS